MTAGSRFEEALALAQESRERLARRLERNPSRADQVEQCLVSKTRQLPTESEFRRAGFHVVRETEEAIDLRIGLWRPEWLNDAKATPPGAAALARARRREAPGVLGDPVVSAGSAVDLPTYRCAGQREAVRSSLRCPPGEAVLIDLSTGAGKSRCFQALAAAEPGRLLVVAVPTTTLCVDQERQFKAFCPSVSHPLAYYSESASRKAAIRERIDDDSQAVLFASPEALTSSLARPLTAAARRGKISALAIDEAHMIDQWGESFRPEFHWLVGLRKSLIRYAPTGKAMRTLLLSATYTQRCVESLESQFGRLHRVHANQLRPEPEYWASKAPNRAVKRRRVLEAVLHLPKPLILYATLRDSQRPVEGDPWDEFLDDHEGDRPDGARQWFERLGRLGLTRVACVTGTTTASDREQIVERFRAGELDIVVGTAAFGLGVDHPGVRTVVHACVPETLDRYYQEVGRGGRDGSASVAIAIYDAEDEWVARRMSRQQLIGIEKGWIRWNRLWAQRESGSGRRAVLTLNRGLLKNSAHREWDDRTIVLTARAGLVSLDFELGEGVGQAEADEPSWQDVRVVSWIDEAVGSELRWKKAVESARSRSAAASQDGLSSMMRFLELGQCGSHELERIYRHAAGGFVSRSCGGCPRCRALRESPYCEPAIVPPSCAWSTPLDAKPPLLRRLGGIGRLVIHFRRSDILGASTRVLKVLDWLGSMGIESFVASSELLQSWWRVGQLRSLKFAAIQEDLGAVPPRDRVAVVVAPGDRVDLSVFDRPYPAIVVICATEAEVSDRPGRSLLTLAPCRVLSGDLLLKEEYLG